MQNDALAWTVPVMRAGYVGRGLTYLAVAGFSLWAIWHGGDAQGTSEALAQLETKIGGGIALFVIAVGLLAYAVWRLLAAALDLDAHGTSARGVLARLGAAIGGAIHLGLAAGAAGLLLKTAQSGDGAAIEIWVERVMAWPGGRWLIGAVGLGIIGAGMKFLVEAWTESYERVLASVPFTWHWRIAMRGGIAAHGLTVGTIGILFLLAAWYANPYRAGGLADAFDWLAKGTYGRTLVAALCLGLAGFAGFCFINARWRIVPRVAGDSTESLALAVRRLAAKA